MTVPGGTSKFQFEKRRAAATVTLSTGSAVDGHFFIAAGITHHEGPERVGEVLNGDQGFIPFEIIDVDGTRTVLLNRVHVVMVALAEDEASRDAGHAVAPQRHVRMRLSTGPHLTGLVRIRQPEGRDRLSDWTRQPDAFRYVESGGRVLLVNMAHVVDVSEVPAS